MSASEQARADAMADAQTCRQVIGTLGLLRGWKSEAEHVARDLAIACRGDMAMLHPREAARAAFRAVPGLRG